MNTRENYKDQQEFLNCEMEFECPKNWFELETTASSKVKHCNTCNKGVHLCITKEDLVEGIKENQCIAFFAVLTIDEQQIVHMRAGLPLSRVNNKFKTFLEE